MFDDFDTMIQSDEIIPEEYDDWCAWKLARSCGNKFYDGVFARVLNNYKNLWDDKNGFFRGRGLDGTWTEPFEPLAFTVIFPPVIVNPPP